MFLRAKTRTKDGKTHRYWSVVENRRVAGGGMVQRQVLYLGELNDNQRAGWIRTVETLWGEKPKAKQLALFPDDREELPVMACETVRVLLYGLTSTYFESDPLAAALGSKKRFGYSRDKRSDCIQVFVA